jgi:ATP synthase subunit 6
MLWLNPLEQFNILVLIDLCYKDFWFVLTNITVMFFFNIFLTLFVIYLVNNSFYLNNMQLFFRLLFLFAWNNMQDSISMKNYSLVSLYYFLFLFIFLSNILGMVPFSITITSHLILTFSYALSFFIGINIIGIRYQKEKWFKLFLPDGVPLFIVPALFLIELISYFARVVSLSVRLFANMLSGHILLKILIGFVWSIGNAVSAIAVTWIFLSFFPLLVVFAVTFLEIVIAFLQAYVFFVLLSIYLNDVINLH